MVTSENAVVEPAARLGLPLIERLPPAANQYKAWRRWPSGNMDHDQNAPDSTADAFGFQCYVIENLAG
jgi:hypothetical protein